MGKIKQELIYDMEDDDFVDMIVVDLRNAVTDLLALSPTNPHLRQAARSVQKAIALIEETDGGEPVNPF